MYRIVKGRVIPEYCLEIAQSHDGSLGYVQAMLEALAKRKIRIVKFQMHLPEFESTLHEPFRVEMSGQDSSRFEYWTRTGFSFNQWKMISDWCSNFGIEFLCTPLSCEAVDYLVALKVKRIKIASGDANNWQLIDYVVSKELPVVLSLGLSSESEIEEIIQRFPKGYPLTILYCISKYPADESDINLHALSILKSRYPNIAVGYSDHTGKPHVAIAAAYYGAEFIEQHVVFHKEQFGPDTSSSVDLNGAETVQTFLDSIRESYSEDSNPWTYPSSTKNFTKDVFSRGLALKNSLKAGEIILENNLTMKKPKGPLGWDARKELIGKKVKRDIDSRYHLEIDDVE